MDFAAAWLRVDQAVGDERADDQAEGQRPATPDATSGDGDHAQLQRPSPGPAGVGEHGGWSGGAQHRAGRQAVPAL